MTLHGLSFSDWPLPHLPTFNLFMPAPVAKRCLQLFRARYNCLPWCSGRAWESQTCATAAVVSRLQLIACPTAAAVVDRHSHSHLKGIKCLQDQEVGVARPPSSHENLLQPAEGGEGERKGHAAYEKAVRQMMGGAPGTAAAAAAVHEGLFADRPTWMSDNPATFTEEQTRQVRAQTAFPLRITII